LFTMIIPLKIKATKNESRVHNNSYYHNYLPHIFAT
jgi:hypothetical protein